MIKVSVIVPMYNAEKDMKRCLDSLVMQTLKDIEIILINDGSTDQTETVIKPYLKDKRIRYITRENLGIGKTRNQGIREAKGEFVGFLDSDDYMELDMYEKMYQKAAKDKLDIVICDYTRIFQDKNELVESFHFENTTLKETPELIYQIHLAPWNKIYKRKLLEENHILFEEELKYEDAPFVIKSYLHAKKIGKINQSFVNYVIHGNSETTVVDDRVFDIIKIIDLIHRMLDKKDYMKEALDYLTVYMLTNYNIQQRVQKKKENIRKFIHISFAYLEQHVKDYKHNPYFKTRGLLRGTIEKNEKLSILYCELYWSRKNSKF